MWKRKEKIIRKIKQNYKKNKFNHKKKNKAKLKGINLRIKHKDKCKT
jgi:hypothetical protein